MKKKGWITVLLRVSRLGGRSSDTIIQIAKTSVYVGLLVLTVLGGRRC